MRRAEMACGSRARSAAAGDSAARRPGRRGGQDCAPHGASNRMTTATESIRLEPVAPRKRLAAAMARTGAGSLASGILSVISTKIAAAMLGPSGVALLATLQ